MTRTLVFPWWARWLPFASRGVAVDDAGIDLAGRAGSAYFRWLEIPEPPQRGAFWPLKTISIRTPRGIYRLCFDNSRDRDLAWQQLSQAWYAPRITEVSERLDYFEAFLARPTYIRSSQLTPILSELGAWRATLPPLPSVEALAAENQATFFAAHQLINDAAQRLSQSREAYIADALAKYETLFNTVETKPLSEQQRRACVIDEDNNLILAGAGTGKTSTVIGRVAFLVRSGQAKPEEILLLAYGSAAVEEMRERLEKRLGVQGVTADTFHALGRRIVEGCEGKKSPLSPGVSVFLCSGWLACRQADPCFTSSVW
ncbi:UvrD-helicase domain-containing protein [Pseudomonas sp. 20GA0068]|uniref:UvrD-helicase domain-containing protein n=2 Tax=Pseudomonas alliivorans TaxID=2810613 RepID=A0ABS4C2X8_9PSED|nr:UvrD-helicase domain-containing protein [Pseudomonas alliivorans]